MRHCDLHRVIRRTVVGALAAAALSVTTPAPSRAVSPTPCFQAGVTYLGRVPVANIGGVQYYRWSYRVCGLGCINRGLSHWTLGLCASTQQQVSGVNSQSDDGTQALNGTRSQYLYKMGNDPTTNVSGIKWNYAGGNPLDTAGECDEFSFVATGGETVVPWAAKGARMVTRGTTIGPGCAPVPVQPRSWGSIKAHTYR